MTAFLHVFCGTPRHISHRVCRVQHVDTFCLRVIISAWFLLYGVAQRGSQVTQVVSQMFGTSALKACEWLAPSDSKVIVIVLLVLACPVPLTYLVTAQ